MSSKYKCNSCHFIINGDGLQDLEHATCKHIPKGRYNNAEDVPFLHPGVAKIHSKRIQSIITDIDFLKNRKDYVMAEEEMGKAIDHLKNAIEKIKA